MSQLGHRLRSLYRVARGRGLLEAFQVSVVNPLYGVWVERVRDDVVRRDGLAFHLDEEGVSTFTKGAIARRRHERQERTLLERHVPPETNVIELGGGVGYLTAIVDRRVDGAVIVVEANPDLVPLLERNRAANDLDYEIVNAAYAPEREAVTFPVASNYKFSSRHKRSGNTTVVPATSLERLVRRYDLDACALIVDVEGDEIELVREELDVLESVCDWLLIEFHAKMTGYEAVDTTRRRLETAGFRSLDRRPGVELFVAEEPMASEPVGERSGAMGEQGSEVAAEPASKTTGERGSESTGERGSESTGERGSESTGVPASEAVDEADPVRSDDE